VDGDQRDNSATNSGAAYVFVREGDNWVQQAYLKSPRSRPDGFFGSKLDVSGDTVAVAALFESAVHVFVRDGTTWNFQQTLTSPAGGGDSFGQAVAVSGDTIVVGARTAGGTGAAYVYVREGTDWTEQARLKASNAGTDDWFGQFVAIDGDTVVVGALFEDSEATGVNGDENNNRASDSGAAYVFVREGMTWSQQAYLKASNTEAGDSFVAVAVSGDTIVVGATSEASSARGVNGDQGDNRALYSGAAYLFEREGTTWSQTAYLKASNSSSDDGFGMPAVSGDTVVIGAPGESSASRGVDGDQRQTGSTNHGAAYVFVIAKPLPELAIKRMDTGLRVSWPLTADGWQLEHSEDMGPGADWPIVPPPYQSDADGFFYTVVDPSGPEFFRLRRP
jgi:hypothetical protein